MTAGGVSAVLVDADGVLQRNPAGWDDDVRAFVAPEDGDRFTDDLWAVEHEALRGERTFADVVAEVAGRWGFRGREDELVALWRRVEVDDGTVAVVRELQAAGVACHLATNQNDVRSSYLVQDVGYGDLFDRCFCSCTLGATKDEPAFFEHVLAELAMAPDGLLLLDDNTRYADAARSAGLRAVTWELEEGVDELRRRLLDAGVVVPAWS